MPRVHSQVKSTRGRERTCGRCGRKIEPGERYQSWSFRYGGTHVRCLAHPPRPSELTQSKMSEVLAAVEAAEDQLAGTETVEDVKGLIEEVAETASQVAEEYREASEPFGYQGENAERADELDGWVNDLQSFDPEEEPVTAEIVDETEETEPDEPEDEPGLSEETLAYYAVEPGRSRQVEREVHRHEWEEANGTWTLQTFDQWWVDADGALEADMGVQRRVKVIPPDDTVGSFETGAGYTVPPDYRAYHARRLASAPKPPEPDPRPADFDYVANAREEAGEILGGCPG